MAEIADFGIIWEIVDTIFSFLDANTLFRCGLVCKTWQERCYDETLWKKLLENAPEVRPVFGLPPRAPPPSRLKSGKPPAKKGRDISRSLSPAARRTPSFGASSSSTSSSPHVPQRKQNINELVRTRSFTPTGEIENVRLWRQSYWEHCRLNFNWCRGVVTETSQLTRASLSRVSGVSFAGRLLATGSDVEHAVKLCDLKSGQMICSFGGHTAGVTCVALSPDSKFLLSGSKDRTVKIWDVSSALADSRLNRAIATGELRPPPIPRNTGVGGGAGGGGLGINYRRASPGSDKFGILTFWGHENPIRDVCIASDKSAIATCAGNDIIVLDMEVQTSVEFRKAHNSQILGVRFDPISPFLVFSVCRGGRLKCIDHRSGSVEIDHLIGQRGSPSSPRELATCFDVVSHQSVACCAFESGKLGLMDLRFPSAAALPNWEGIGDSVARAGRPTCLQMDSSKAVVGWEDAGVRVVNLRKWREHKESEPRLLGCRVRGPRGGEEELCNPHDGPISCLKYSGSRLVSACLGGKLVSWRIGEVVAFSS